jgi:hypothetical protein
VGRSVASTACDAKRGFGGARSIALIDGRPEELEQQEADRRCHFRPCLRRSSMFLGIPRMPAGDLLPGSLSRTRLRTLDPGARHPHPLSSSRKKASVACASPSGSICRPCRLTFLPKLLGDALPSVVRLTRRPGACRHARARALWEVPGEIPRSRLCSSKQPGTSSGALWGTLSGGAPRQCNNASGRPFTRMHVIPCRGSASLRTCACSDQTFAQYLKETSPPRTCLEPRLAWTSPKRTPTHPRLPPPKARSGHNSKEAQCPGSPSDAHSHLAPAATARSPPARPPRPVGPVGRAFTAPARPLAARRPARPPRPAARSAGPQPGPGRAGSECIRRGGLAPRAGQRSPGPRPLASRRRSPTACCGRTTR